MSAKILDGKVVSESIKAKLKEEIEALSGQPGLAVILVGDNPASRVYVNHKKKVCAEIGIQSFEFLIDPAEGEARLIEVLNECNAREEVHGILLQLPLPDGFDDEKMLEYIDSKKDVDGLHPMNIGKMLIGLDSYRSCTPYGVMELLKFYDIDPNGKHVVIMGRSNLVGKPLAAMMVQKEAGANATVTICHSRTENIENICSQADILVAAIGIPEFVKANMVKEGAVVIDVGINRIDAPETEKGTKLVGDVDYNAVIDKVSAITPVPGGVGPMTIAILMMNTVKSFKER